MFAILAFIAAATAPTPFTPTPAQNVAIADAERRGRDIFDFDQAAWVTTDALLKALPDPNKAGVKGWIVERDSSDTKGLLATYYGVRDGKPYKLFVAHAVGRAVVDQHLIADEDDSALTAAETAMIAARSAFLAKNAATRDIRPCTPGNMNTVMLPASEGSYSLYMLSAQPTAGSAPAGGHYRFDIAADGSVKTARLFMKSCMLIDPGRQQRPDRKPEAFVLTHLLDQQPTEIHVWLSRILAIPLLVVTTQNGELWTVDNGLVRPSGRLERPATP